VARVLDPRGGTVPDDDEFVLVVRHAEPQISA
jgi:hypothetical protein